MHLNDNEELFDKDSNTELTYLFLASPLNEVNLTEMKSKKLFEINFKLFY